MKIRNIEKLTRSFVSFAVFSQVFIAAWRLAFHQSFDQTSTLIDILAFVLLTWSHYLHTRHDVEPSHHKKFLSAKIFLYMPIATILSIFGISSAALHLFWVPRLAPSIKLIADSSFLAPFPVQRKRYDLAMIGLLVAAILHTFASVWIAINPTTDTDISTIYNKALYWTVTTVATVGYGDITPSTNSSRVFAMGVMLFGVAFYGFIISKISSFIFERNRRDEAHNEKMEQLSSFLDFYQIPAEFRREVYKFYDHRIRAQANDEEQKILSELPDALREELQVYLNIAPISRTHLFQKCSQPCLRAAAEMLDLKVIAPGEKLIQKGDPGEEMYIIGHGTVAVVDNHHKLATLGKGQFFGEMSLISQELRSADVIAQSYCDLFILTKEKFDVLVSEHADLRENVETMAKQRMRKAG